MRIPNHAHILLLISCSFITSQPYTAYWHIYWNDILPMESLLYEQINVIISSGLYHRLDRIYYTTIGNETQLLSLNLSIYSKFQHLTHLSHGHEVHTLAHLYKDCHDQSLSNPTAKVLYFHNKGSYSFFHRNAEMRRALDCHVLTPACLDMLDHYGMRVSPIPVPHYPGNFWWATCKYIRSLVSPLSYLENVTFRNLTNAILPDSYEWCVGKGRYFAEMWLLSPPIFHSADCLPIFSHGKYLYGIHTPNAELLKVCPNVKNSTAQTVPYPLYPNRTCGSPYVLKNKQAFRLRIMSELSSRIECASLRVLEERTAAWYGQSSVTARQWIRGFGQIKLHRNRTSIAS